MLLLVADDVTGFGFGFGNELADEVCEVFTHGDDGNDIGEDNLSGDVGVPKLVGSDILESEELKEFTFISDLSSEGSGVQRTVGNDIFLVDFCSLPGEPSMIFCNKRCE